MKRLILKTLGLDENRSSFLPAARMSRKGRCAERREANMRAALDEV